MQTKSTNKKTNKKPTQSSSLFLKLLFWLFFLPFAGALSIAAIGTIAYASAYNRIPDVEGLMRYEPKLPLRIFTEDGLLIGEYSEERREFVPIDQIPQTLKNALLAVEDASFYQHHGVDPKGILRAFVSHLKKAGSEGASTITMQVARHFYLSNEKTYNRKIFEILTSLRIESVLSKQQILEIYMNQIFLGHRSYGFAAAAQTYFGKTLDELTLAESAMLAGLPKAPSSTNPISTPAPAKARQKHVLNRMLAVGAITQQEYQAAVEEPIQLKKPVQREFHAEYAADEAQQILLEAFKDQAYTSGLNVYTTIKSEHQRPAYQALRNGIISFEKNQFYRGPEGQIELPSDPTALAKAVTDALGEYPDNGELLTAVVLSATPKEVVVTRNGVDPIKITGNGLKPVQSGLAANAKESIKIKTGSIVRIHAQPKETWDITQIPSVEGSVVSLDTHTGAILAMVGGFDFTKNKFNHSTQAWRQPGSSFKPLVYSAALERGITPLTTLNDAPIIVRNPGNNKPWTPKNFGGNFRGKVSLPEAIMRSLNIPAILTIDAITPEYAQQWIQRFGFEPEKNPANLTLILGTGAVTPMQMTTAYGVFANGGYKIDPYLIAKITDPKGNVIYEYQPPELTDERRVIPERNAFVMSTLLNGSASASRRALNRHDLYGKTGTTNDSHDTWYIGYQPSIVASVWVGYDQPRSLGAYEIGGRRAQPIWNEYMKIALEGVPVQPVTKAKGVSSIGGQWVYDEFAGSSGVRSLGDHLSAEEDDPTDSDSANPMAQSSGSQSGGGGNSNPFMF